MRSTQWLAFPALMLPALAVPPPYIALRGTSPMKWYSVLGDWEEPGFTCTDVFEGELGPKYVTMSPTAQQFAKDAAQPGEHVIDYTCRNKVGLTSTARRIVHTTKEPPADATPVLIMDGPTTLVFDLKSLGKRAQSKAYKDWFPDPGVDCYDPQQGKVFVTSHVPDDIHEEGDHSVTYKCSTDKGLSTVLTRRVLTVVKKPVLELRGENPSYFRPPTATPAQFVDAGASCYDTDGTDISTLVATAIPDMRVAHHATKPVVRTILYTCVNKMGVPATPVSRTVYVEVAHKASPPGIVMKGNEIEILPYDSNSYSDPGASCFDKHDGKIDSIISDIPDFAIKGRHAVTYTCRNSRGGVATAQRLVYSGYRVNELPTITLKGPKVVHTRACDMEYDDDCGYTDPGAVCRDPNGKEVMNVDVMIPDMTKPGVTYVEYSCKDNQGMPARDVKRKVVVSVTPPAGSPVISLHGPAVRHVQPCSHDCSTVWRAIAKDVTCKDGKGNQLDVDYAQPDISRPSTVQVRFGCMDDMDESAMPISIKLIVHNGQVSHGNARGQSKQFEPAVEPVESENSREATHLSWLNLLESGPAAPMLVVAAVALVAICFSSQGAAKGRRLHPRNDARREDGDEHENEGLVGGDRRTTAEVLDRPNSRSNVRRRSSAAGHDSDSD